MAVGVGLFSRIATPARLRGLGAAFTFFSEGWPSALDLSYELLRTSARGDLEERPSATLVVGHCVGSVAEPLELGRPFGLHETNVPTRIVGLEAKQEPRLAALELQRFGLVVPFECPRHGPRPDMNRQPATHHHARPRRVTLGEVGRQL